MTISNSADSRVSQITVHETTPAPIESEPQVAPTVPTERVIFTPPIDIYESGDGLVLIADLPGVSVKSLELQVQNNKLTLLGRVARHAPPEAQVLHKEYEEGDFLRSFILSEDVDHDRVTARLTNGVLEVVLPRFPKAAPRKIEVSGS